MSGFSFAVGNKKKTPFQVIFDQNGMALPCSQMSISSYVVLQKHKEQEEEKKRVRHARCGCFYLKLSLHDIL